MVEEPLLDDDGIQDASRPEWLTVARHGSVLGFEPNPDLVGHAFSSWRATTVTVRLENRLASNLGANANSVFFLFIGGLFVYLLTDRESRRQSKPID